MASEPGPNCGNIARGSTETFCNCCQKPVASARVYRIAAYDVIRCPHCGLMFVPQTEDVAQSLARLYSKQYFEGGMADGYVDYNASETVLRQQAQRTLRSLRRYEPCGALLEIGCAYGFFLLEAKETYQTSGIELSSFAAEQAKNRGLNVICGDFAKESFAKDQFDVVCLFDCIEHLTDPFGYLKKIHDVLKPERTLALTTGDVGSLYARVAGTRWRLMTPPQHLYYFSRETLCRMLAKTGFEPVHVSYPWKLVPWRLILYQLGPRLKKRLGPMGQLPFGIYVNLFDAMLVIAKKK